MHSARGSKTPTEPLEDTANMRIYEYHSVLVEMLVQFEHYALVKHGAQSFIVDKVDLEFVAGAPVEADLKFWPSEFIASETYSDEQELIPAIVSLYHEKPVRSYGRKQIGAGFNCKTREVWSF